MQAGLPDAKPGVVWRTRLSKQIEAMAKYDVNYIADQPAGSRFQQSI
jgi:hypothetical protein